MAGSRPPTSLLCEKNAHESKMKLRLDSYATLKLLAPVAMDPWC